MRRRTWRCAQLQVMAIERGVSFPRDRGKLYEMEPDIQMSVRGVRLLSFGAGHWEEAAEFPMKGPCPFHPRV